VARAEKSIVVRVPVRAAFRGWTSWEEFPEFLDGVNRVAPRDGATQDWDVEIAGRAMRWETRVEARDERHVAWRTTGHPHAEGGVELKPVEGGQTLVTLTLSYQPEGEHDVEGAGGMVDRMVMNSLERFKAYAEPLEERRLPDDNAPPPRGAETVDGPQGELGATEAEDGEPPFDDSHRRHGHGMEAGPEGFESLLEQIDNPGAAPEREPSVDVNLGDNEASWSRTPRQ